MQTARYWTQVLIITGVLLMVVLYCSCREQPGPGGPVIYPRGWPIKSLKVPEGSVAAELKLRFDCMKLSNGDCAAIARAYGYTGVWAVGFNYSGDWDSAIKEIESSIGGLKCQEFEPAGGPNTSTQQRYYTVEADNGRKYVLKVTHWSGERDYYWAMLIKDIDWPASR